MTMRWLVVVSLLLGTANGAWFSSEQDDDSVLVSSIVNRQLEASVVAHSWPSTVQNVFCEAWAFHQESNPSLFLDSFLNQDGVFATYDEATEAVLKAAAPNDRPLLQYALALRAYSPLCEMNRGLARQVAIDAGLYNMFGKQSNFTQDVLAVVYPSGKVVTDPTSMEQLLSSTPNIETPSDVLLPGESFLGAQSDNVPVVVLYANVGSKAFKQFYSKLKSRENVKWVVRHLGAIDYEEVGGEPTVLQGYGVRLDIRNVEYRAFDDDKSGSDQDILNVSSLQDISPHVLGGVNVSSLDLSKEEAIKVQKAAWKQHEAQQLHSQLVPPKWQRQQLPLQAASVMANAAPHEDVLLLLQDVSQNLPSVASTLVHVDVKESLEELAEAMEDLRLLQSSGAVLLLNGRKIPIDRPSFNVFELLNLIRKEHGELQKMKKTLGPYMGTDALAQVHRAWTMGDDAFNEKKDGMDDVEEDEESPSSSSDVFRIDVGRGWSQAVMYLNDIEKDAQYRQWPKQVQQMMFAMQFGQPPAVQRNIYTMLAVVDPMESTDNPGFNVAMQTMKSHYPVRTGLLLVNKEHVKECAKWLSENAATLKNDTICPVPPIFENDVPPSDLNELHEVVATTVHVHRLVMHVLSMHKGSWVGGAYVERLLSVLPPEEASFSLYDLLTMHGDILADFQIMSQDEAIQRAKKQMAKTQSDDPLYGKALRFAAEKNLKPGMSFLNGRPMPLANEESADEMAGRTFMEEQNVIFGLIMGGEITDTSPRSIYAHLLSGSKVFKKVHPLLTESKENAYFDLDHELGPDSLLVPETHLNDALEQATAVSVIDVVVDLDSAAGLDMVSDTLSVIESIPPAIEDDTVPISVGWRIVPSTKSSASHPLCPVLAHAGLFDMASLKRLLDKARDGITSVEDLLSSVPRIDADKRSKVLSAGQLVCAGLPYLENELPSNNFITGNARLYVPEGNPITKDDVELLLKLDLSRAKGMTKLLRPHLSSKDPGYHDAISRATAFIATQQSGTQRQDLEGKVIDLEKELKIEDSPLRFSWNDAESSSELGVKITAVVDPISEATQRLAPLLFAFRDQLRLPLTLILAPEKLSDGGDEKYPFTSYYRFVADPKASPDANPPRAYFDNLPTNHVLTLRMDVPEPWNVQQTHSIQDTDNLRCDASSGCGDDAQAGTMDTTIPVHERRHSTRVEYGLKDLLFFGQCYDATSGSPPNGLQLTLSRDSAQQESREAEINADGTIASPLSSDGESSVYSDTLVMKTVGYWQLRATPGVWKLSIAKGSRGAEIFDIVDGSIKYGKLVVKEDSASNRDTKTLVMNDFVNRGELLMVKRRSGYEQASLFYEEEGGRGLTNKEDVINVFSLATGHLYERFLKIMMLSVTKRTSKKVKFWLFENFLSPSFKATAIDMAKRIGCQVEFVTYKWPEWLRGQSEKQRIIWGYKILFLDVLFPLGVKKIIYVDADQVVRGDLKELWDMDLHGAPYGYTPMCDSRESTLGFQFWRTGFWKSHLRGKPYHISALYVVDLEKFRRDLVGDNLRSIYQQLSADPNSLANLDQDLPNYAQHGVPIFSLPQEWLWCESWCSDETKASAKTIDLCNNPLHKEPKVSMAKRVISGDLFNESWVELDAEVEQYEREYRAAWNEPNIS